MSNSQSMWEYNEIESFSLIPELRVGRWGEFATESKSNAKKLKNRRVRLCDWVRLWERGDGEPSGTGEQWSTEWERADEWIGWDTLGFCYFGQTVRFAPFFFNRPVQHQYSVFQLIQCVSGMKKKRTWHWRTGSGVGQWFSGHFAALVHHRSALSSGSWCLDGDFKFSIALHFLEHSKRYGH